MPFDFTWETFQPFTYSKHEHISRFMQAGYETALYGNNKNIANWGLKRYQDLLVFSFIKQMVPEGSRILEVGGGKSRIIAHFKDRYECWNVDKLEGLGQGPTSLDTTGYRLVRDYMGQHNPEIPPNTFDFVFSISALEHVPGHDPEVFENIRTDINRVLKPGAYSLHCFDTVLGPREFWISKLLLHFFHKEKAFNPFIPYEIVSKDQDLFTLPEEQYNKNWLKRTKQSYQDYGKPFSYNILWKKELGFIPSVP